ncbi:MAG: hypothetical protein SOU48_06185, partial [Prevotella sp.]|nr:hypothetical protein [Prevotella sp.]
ITLASLGIAFQAKLAYSFNSLDSCSPSHTNSTKVCLSALLSWHFFKHQDNADSYQYINPNAHNGMTLAYPVSMSSFTT